MQEHDLSFVRAEMAIATAPPPGERGLGSWLRKNLFASTTDSILTVLGLLMLGPNRHYKDHYHPAPELYWPLTGPTDWKQGAGGFETKPAGSLIWHIPWKVHATITDEKPLLAVWSWTCDTMTPAKLVGA